MINLVSSEGNKHSDSLSRNSICQTVKVNKTCTVDKHENFENSGTKIFKEHSTNSSLDNTEDCSTLNTADKSHLEGSTSANDVGHPPVAAEAHVPAVEPANSCCDDNHVTSAASALLLSQSGIDIKENEIENFLEDVSSLTDSPKGLMKSMNQPSSLIIDAVTTKKPNSSKKCKKSNSSKRALSVYGPSLPPEGFITSEDNDVLTEAVSVVSIASNSIYDSAHQVDTTVVPSEIVSESYPVASICKSVQTESSLLESQIFTSFAHDLEKAKDSRGYCGVDNLASMELDTDHGWLDLLVKQLKIRDSILAEMTDKIEFLRKHGADLEMDMDYLQLKITCLEGEVKKLKSQVKKKRKHSSQCTQTASSGTTYSYEEWQSFLAAQGYCISVMVTNGCQTSVPPEVLTSSVHENEVHKECDEKSEEHLLLPNRHASLSSVQQPDTLSVESVSHQVESECVQSLSLSAEAITEHSESYLAPVQMHSLSAPEETDQSSVCSLPLQGGVENKLKEPVIIIENSEKLSEILAPEVEPSAHMPNQSAPAHEESSSTGFSPILHNSTNITVPELPIPLPVETTLLPELCLTLDETTVPSISKSCTQNIGTIDVHVTTPTSVTIKVEKASPGTGVTNSVPCNENFDLNGTEMDLKYDGAVSSQGMSCMVPSSAEVAKDIPMLPPLQPPPLPMFQNSLIAVSSLQQMLPHTTLPNLHDENLPNNDSSSVATIGGTLLASSLACQANSEASCLPNSNNLAPLSLSKVNVPISDPFTIANSSSGLQLPLSLSPDSNVPHLHSSNTDNSPVTFDVESSIVSKHVSCDEIVSENLLKRKRNDSCSSSDSIKMLELPPKISKIIETVTLDDAEEPARGGKQATMVPRDLLQETLSGPGKKSELTLEEMLRLKKIELLKVHEREEAKRLAKASNKQRELEENTRKARELSKESRPYKKKSSDGRRNDKSRSLSHKRDKFSKDDRNMSHKTRNSRSTRRSKSPNYCYTSRSRSPGRSSSKTSDHRRSVDRSYSSVSKKYLRSTSSRHSPSLEYNKKPKTLKKPSKSCERTSKKEKDKVKSSPRKTHKKKSRREKKAKKKESKKRSEDEIPHAKKKKAKSKKNKRKIDSDDENSMQVNEKTEKAVEKTIMKNSELALLNDEPSKENIQFDESTNLEVAEEKTPENVEDGSQELPGHQRKEDSLQGSECYDSSESKAEFAAGRNLSFNGSSSSSESTSESDSDSQEEKNCEFSSTIENVQDLKFPHIVDKNPEDITALENPVDNTKSTLESASPDDSIIGSIAKTDTDVICVAVQAADISECLNSYEDTSVAAEDKRTEHSKDEEQPKENIARKFSESTGTSSDDEPAKITLESNCNSKTSDGKLSSSETSHIHKGFAMSFGPQQMQDESSGCQKQNFTYLDDFQLYYDQSSGYYYDPSYGVYYDSNSSTFCYLDSVTQEYQYVPQLDEQRAKPFALLMLSLYQQSQGSYGPTAGSTSEAGRNADDPATGDGVAATIKDRVDDVTSGAPAAVVESVRGVNQNTTNSTHLESSAVMCVSVDCVSQASIKLNNGNAKKDKNVEIAASATSGATLEEIEYANATIIARAQLNKGKVSSSLETETSSTNDGAVVLKKHSREQDAKLPLPKSPKSIMQSLRQSCALLGASGSSSTKGEVTFRKRRRTTDAAGIVSGQSAEVELDEAAVDSEETITCTKRVKVKDKKKKEKRKSTEVLEEGECSSDSLSSELVSSSTSNIPRAAKESSSLAYEEELRERIAGRLLRRSLAGAAAAAVSTSGAAASPSGVAAEDEKSHAIRRGSDDYKDYSSTSSSEGSASEDEASEESVWKRNYAEHLRRKELLGGDDVAPSLRLMLVGLGPTPVTPSLSSTHPLSAPPPPPRLPLPSKVAKKLSLLHVVTVDGASVGRLSSSGVHLPHLSVSKLHAALSYRSAGPGDHHYSVQDSGSNNGTYVNGERLSGSKTPSGERELGHGWLVAFGEVQMQVHLHPGHLTCNTCEPGLMAPAEADPHDAAESGSSSEQQRRQAAASLRRQYGLGLHDNTSSGPALGAAAAAGYADRADVRRATVGSDNPYEKTSVASVHESLRSSNKGFQLLQKMGWSEGSGLGRGTGGRLEPVLVEGRPDGAGLGAEVPSVAPLSAQRQRLMETTLRRYKDRD